MNNQSCDKCYKFYLTMSSDLPIQYFLLSEANAFAARVLLERTHNHFYHFTVDDHLESIKNKGLNPCFEGKDSHYADRKREPANAIRYCTIRYLALGLSAATTRNQVWNSQQYMLLPREPERIILLRTKARALLSRAFGLDYSHSEISYAAEALLTATQN